MAERIKVTLRYFQILDTKEPFFKERGEFRFTARIDADGSVVETKLPSEGHYEISAHPAWNKLNLDRVLFEGPVEKKLVVELNGEEVDALSRNDQLIAYRREFTGAPDSWVGHYGPGEIDQDTDPDDPENMADWRVSYDVEKA